MINVFTASSQRLYRITNIRVVEPTEVWVMSPTGSEVLTLITCVPVEVYNQRLIVRAVPIT